jgi:hypothetical protein
MSQQGIGASLPHIEAPFNATGPTSQWKSSVASTELPADDESAFRYPVDDITDATPCELHVKVVNITMKVAVGYALPIGPNPTYHYTLVPHGYADAGVDQVTSAFEEPKLDYPTGEGDFYELGEAKKAPFYGQRNTSCFQIGHQGLQRIIFLHHRLSLLCRVSCLCRFTGL